MTAIVGMLCQDGVVIGADSAIVHATSSGQYTIERHGARKIDFIGGKAIVAGTGYTGHHQRFCQVVERHLLPKIRRRSGVNEIDVCRELGGKAHQDFQVTGWMQGIFGAVVAFPAGDSPVLCEYDPKAFQPDVKDDQNWFCSLGSSQAITDSSLEFFADVFSDGGPPTVAGGILAVTWTMDHVVAVNPGGVGGDVQIAVLERRRHSGQLQWKPRLLTADDLSEHRDWIAQARAGLREHLEQMVSVEEDLPPKP